MKIIVLYAKEIKCRVRVNLRLKCASLLYCELIRLSAALKVNS